MNSIFQYSSYLLKRQALALTGKFRFYDPMGNLVMFSEQKMFKLREDIRVYSDENKTQEVLSNKARQIIDFSAAYDVVDTASNQKVGALRRKGWRSMLRTFGPLGSRDQARRVRQYCETAVADGARTQLDGAQAEGPG